MDINFGELTVKLVELAEQFCPNFSEEAQESICKAFLLEMKRQHKHIEKQNKVVQMLHITPETEPELLHHLIYERTRALKRLEWKDNKYELTYSDDVLKQINDERKNKMFEYRQTYHHGKKLEKLAKRQTKNASEEQKQEPEQKQEQKQEPENMPSEPKYEQTKKVLKKFRELPMNKKNPEKEQETLNV
jgi:hypothetical protein